DPAVTRRLFGRIERFPQVEAYASVNLAQGELKIPGSKRPGDVFPIVSLDGRFGRTINAVKILQGRMYNPRASDEIVPSFSVADDLGLRVGETLRLVYGGIFVNGPVPQRFKR